MRHILDTAAGPFRLVRTDTHGQEPLVSSTTVSDQTEFVLEHPFVPTGNGKLADELYEHLRSAIRQGEIPPGRRLVEDAIAAGAAVSRTPVREALRRLVTAGLATHSGNRGLVVASLNSDDFQELWEVLEGLEVTAARLAAENRSNADVAEMTVIVRGPSKGRLTHSESAELNRRFRMCMLRASGNRHLAQMLDNIVTQVESLASFSAARSRDTNRAEHEAVLEAIRRRDPDGADAAIREHLQLVLAEALIEMHRDGDQ
jgi:DNA-binding GntR family transcriptional regulator